MITWEIALGVVVGGAILILLSPMLVSLRGSLTAKPPVLWRRAWKRVIGWSQSARHWIKFAWHEFMRPRDGKRSIANLVPWILIVLLALIFFALSRGTKYM